MLPHHPNPLQGSTRCAGSRTHPVAPHPCPPSLPPTPAPPQETKVLYPMLRPELYCTTLWRQTKGVLLWVMGGGGGGGGRRGWCTGGCSDADC